LLLLKCVDVNIYKNVFKFVHYAYMYRMYDVFLICVHVVADVDDFFPCFVFSQSRLVVICYQFIITSCFDKYSFCCFFSLIYFISSLLMVGESLCKPCTVLYCTVFGVNRLYMLTVSVFVSVFYITYINSVRTSQEAYYISVLQPGTPTTRPHNI
jgi:hypothetical protein